MSRVSPPHAERVTPPTSAEQRHPHTPEAPVSDLATHPLDARSARRDPRPLAALAAALVLACAGATVHAAPLPVGGGIVPGQPIRAVGSAVVNFSELARREALGQGVRPPVRPLLLPELEEDGEPGANSFGPPAAAPLLTPATPQAVMLASPSPDISYMGLDDIPMVDSSYIVIPPDVDGGVGPTRLFEGLNNNYRVIDKSTGATISTVGTATFWAPTGAALNVLTDPRIVYDPYNNVWIAEMQTFQSSADILVGVSQTSDPAGAWYLYRFNTGVSIDFPNLGFNKNWIVVSINRYSSGGTFQRGITLIVNYPQARAGVGTGTIVTQAANTHFCSAPCATFSSTSDTEYVVTHLSSSSATYTLDAITGTPSAPVYTAGGSLTRTGGGWAQPSGNLLPQSAPVSGSSACGSTPCPIETQDSQVRSAPVFRGGSIWYTQTIGLPASGLTHTAVQWTRITTPGGAFVEGGRIEDATATSSNGGLWYAYPHIAVNATGDFMFGFSQFSSAQHPSAGYAMHLAADGAGTLRDPLVYHAGEDYYHKTFSTTTGRNRWGDFSTCSVDPDDSRLWTVEEYAKARHSTDDGNTGSNGSRWSTWWASVGGTAPVVPTVTIDPGPSLPEGNSGTTPFDFTVRLSAATTQPVTVQYQTVDGTATVANNDYQPLNTSLTIPAGATTGTITVSVVGDTLCEPDETFGVSLTSATNGTLGSTVSSTGTILNDDSKTIAASAGTGGTISPTGLLTVGCFGSQSFSITPSTGYQVADVLVDGVSVGAVTSYGFTNVTTSHSIAASFAANVYTLALTSLGTGSLTKSPNQASYPYGTIVQLTATPGTGFAFSGWSGDASGSTDPLDVTMDANKSVTATFADTAAPAVTVLAPNGGEALVQNTVENLQWSAFDNHVVARLTLRLSRTGSGGPFDTLADNVPNTGTYAWTVTGPFTTDAFFQVVARDSAGNAGADTSNAAFAINSTTGVDDAPVTTLELAPVAPNPVRGPGVVAFALPERMRVQLGVLDVQGREVAVLADGEMGPGRYRQAWHLDAASRGSGLYFLRLRAGGRTLVQRVVVIE